MTVRTEPNATAGWVDVSVPLRDGMVHWPDNPPVHLSRELDLARGDDATVSKLSLGVHSGTHVDAPVHFIAGAPGVDALPLDRLMGEARVLDFQGVQAITPEALRAHAPRSGERLLFKTDNSARCWRTDAFLPDFVYLSLDAARYLAALRVRTVGIDYLSIASPTAGIATHRALLEAGVCIIEGLDLSPVSAGSHELLCLPLRIQGGDGAPARALLRRH
ncbi:cyclase family protein [Myxococcaceae bacterium GXIMD 01537]